jgi:hypothetical protein
MQIPPCATGYLDDTMVSMRPVRAGEGSSRGVRDGGALPGPVEAARLPRPDPPVDKVWTSPLLQLEMPLHQLQELTCRS